MFARMEQGNLILSDAGLAEKRVYLAALNGNINMLIAYCFDFRKTKDNFIARISYLVWMLYWLGLVWLVKLVMVI